MSRVIDISGDVLRGNKAGAVVQLNDGSFILSSADANTIYKSNDGISWSLKHTFSVGGYGRSIFLARNGHIYIGLVATTALYLPSILARSIDSGETWQEVLTVESNALWYIAEDSIGRIYVGEYSHGGADAGELFGRHIWKSSDMGNTWVKIFSGAQNTAPSYRNGDFRHIHGVFVDSNDNLYFGVGDYISYANSGDSYVSDLSASNIKTISTFDTFKGNGFTAYVEFGGRVLCGGDNYPISIYNYVPGDDSVSLNINLDDSFQRDVSPILSMCVGKHGVIYALGNNEGTMELPTFFLSDDGGLNWVQAYFTKDTSIFPLALAINKNIDGSRVYFSSGINAGYFSIPDYTPSELRSLYTSTLTIKTS